MGQRLNIEIYSDGECQANCYYHWSAYTGSAICETLKIIDNYINNVKSKFKTSKEQAVMSLSTPSSLSFYTSSSIFAGLKEESYNYMKENFPELPIKEATDRNAGLIGCTETDMENTRNWEEGRVTINLDTESIIFDVLLFYNIENYIQDRQDWDDEFDTEQILNLPIFRGNICELTFKQFELFSKFIFENKCDFLTNINGELNVISLIE